MRPRNDISESECLICSLPVEIRWKLENLKTLVEQKKFLVSLEYPVCYQSHLKKHRMYHPKISLQDEIEELEEKVNVEIVNSRGKSRLVPKKYFDIDFSQFGNDKTKDLELFQKQLAQLLYKLIIVAHDDIESSVREGLSPTTGNFDNLKKIADVYARYTGLDFVVNINRAIEFLTSQGFVIAESSREIDFGKDDRID